MIQPPVSLVDETNLALVEGCLEMRMSKQQAVRLLYNSAHNFVSDISWLKQSSGYMKKKNTSVPLM